MPDRSRPLDESPPVRSPVAGTRDPRDDELETLVSDVLRRAIRASSPSPTSDGADIHDALRRLCDGGKRHRLQPEQLLVLLKEAWLGLPEARALPRGSVRDNTLGRVITLCIAEYYAPRAD